MRAWASSSWVDGGSASWGGITTPQLGQQDGLGSTKRDVVFEAAAVTTMVDDIVARMMLCLSLCDALFPAAFGTRYAELSSSFKDPKKKNQMMK